MPSKFWSAAWKWEWCGCESRWRRCWQSSRSGRSCPREAVGDTPASPERHLPDLDFALLVERSLMPHAVPSRLLAVLGLCFTVAAVSACGGAQARKARHLEKGQAYLTAGNYEKARVEFLNAMQIAPADPEARFES